MALYLYFSLVLSLFASEVRACDDVSQASPLYRAWNPTISDHFYTTDPTEAADAVGYTYEGVRAMLFTTQVSDSVQFLRLYSAGAGDHFYTTNVTEAQLAVANVGYVIEDKTPMYIYPTQLCGSVPFYRLFAAAVGDHFYTVNVTEMDGAEQSGWAYELIAGYVFPPPDTSASTSTMSTFTTSTTEPVTSAPAPPPAPTSSKTTAASSAPPSSPSAPSSAPSAPAPGTSDPVDVLPASTSMLGGTTLADTVPSSTPSGLSGTSAGTRMYLAPAYLSPLAAVLAVIFSGRL
jgi:hypothetical protein